MKPPNRKRRAPPRSTDDANSKKKRGTAQKMDSFTSRQDRRVQQSRSQNIGVNPSSSNEQRGAETTSSPPVLQLHQPEPVISQSAVLESQQSASRLHQPEPVSASQNSSFGTLTAVFSEHSSSGTLNAVISELSQISNIADVGGIAQASLIGSIFDPVSAHIPLRIKEKIWKGEFIQLSILLKFARDLVQYSVLDGEFVLKGDLNCNK